MATITLTQDNFQTEVLQSELPVLVDFWAPWCGPCQMLGPIIDELANELSGTVKVCKLNVDDNSALASQYGIASVPAVLIFNQGQLKNTLIGFRQKQDYLDALK
jgi:thioredoxin 1